MPPQPSRMNTMSTSQPISFTGNELCRLLRSKAATTMMKCTLCLDENKTTEGPNIQPFTKKTLETTVERAKEYIRYQCDLRPTAENFLELKIANDQFAASNGLGYHVKCFKDFTRKDW